MLLRHTLDALQRDFLHPELRLLKDDTQFFVGGSFLIRPNEMTSTRYFDIPHSVRGANSTVAFLRISSDILVQCIISLFTGRSLRLLRGGPKTNPGKHKKLENKKQNTHTQNTKKQKQETHA